jgi:hypothetical protein
MMHIRKPTAVVGAAVIAVALLGGVLLRSGVRRSHPQTLYDAVEIAEALGLYHCSDALAGRLNSRVIISELPLTWERAAGTPLHPDHPCLVWTVAVYYDPNRQWADANYVPAYSAIWGDLFIFGDPRLIEKLTGAPVTDTPDRWPLD